MFIWTAIDVEEELKSVKENVKKIEELIQFNESNLTLPLHVSLKISMNVEDSMYELIIQSLTNYFSNIKPFIICPEAIELHQSICWIKMKESEWLTMIHEDLNKLMLEKYNVSLHEYDKKFIFHTTLFLDNDIDKVKKAFLNIKDMSLPNELKVNKFIIGFSNTGNIGSYQVLKVISI